MKGNKTGLGIDDLRRMSRRLKMGHEDMDSIEEAVYGNINRVQYFLPDVQ